MTYISLPEDKDRLLVFYLAMEEYIARYMNVDDAFFMWQTAPTVIFGRNQLINNEVNIDYCREKGIKMFRRKSGGGCVYSDMNNIMFSYVTKEENVNMTFNRYVNMVALVLCKLGVDARATGRNDILIDGKKVSGNAFYHIPGRSIVHGTMLFDTCLENMVASITPSDAKLVSKGVKSVRQRITLLKDHIDLSIDEFKKFVRSNLCNNEIVLDQNAIVKIEELMQEYLDIDFIYGKNPKYSIIRSKRIEKVGSFEVQIELKNVYIKDVNLMGDFFLLGDIGAVLHQLRGIRYEREAISNMLPNNIGDYILNMTKQDMVELLI